MCKFLVLLSHDIILCRYKEAVVHSELQARAHSELRSTTPRAPPVAASRSDSDLGGSGPAASPSAEGGEVRLQIEGEGGGEDDTNSATVLLPEEEGGDAAGPSNDVPPVSEAEC